MSNNKNISTLTLYGCVIFSEMGINNLITVTGHHRNSVVLPV
jgi:hypothetical protein